jgi:hypothetical protein
VIHNENLQHLLLLTFVQKLLHLQQQLNIEQMLVHNVM